MPYPLPGYVPATSVPAGALELLSITVWSLSSLVGNLDGGHPMEGRNSKLTSPGTPSHRIVSHHILRDRRYRTSCLRLAGRRPFIMSSSSLLPFLYQTRTILRSRRLPGSSPSLRRLVHDDYSRSPSYSGARTPPWIKPKRKYPENYDTGSQTHDIPFAADVPVPKPPVGEEAPKGTITPTERQTFDRIFADIAARGMKPDRDRDLPPPSAATQRLANVILGSAAVDAGQQTVDGPVSPTFTAASAKDKTKALLRFPPSLRAAASKALHILDPNLPPSSSDEVPDAQQPTNTVWDTPKNSLMQQVQLEAKRYPEEMRVQGLMDSANSDFELWDVLEQEVFCLPSKFGLGTKKELRELRRDQRRAELARQKRANLRVLQGKKPTKSQKRDMELEAQELDDNKMSLYTYGPLYPSFLVQGLRLLDSKFGVSSPLALNVLPRVKELGLESYVLGVSTPFFNELLNIYCSRYGDLNKALGVLEEMKHSGLYFDEGTSAVLHHMQDMANTLAGGAYGLLGQALSTMPEYDSSVRRLLGGWQRSVDVSIAQRQRDIDPKKLNARSF